MQQPDLTCAASYALERLARELVPTLRYHSLAHTRDDVVPAAERLAELGGVVGDALLLLRTAAYYHDVGFVQQRAEHEAASVAIARLALPSCGYSAAHIDTISDMIMATRLPQSPRTLPEQLLADADLDVLGRGDFLKRNQTLRAELAAFGAPLPDNEWYEQQIRFLQSHRYWTPAARDLRDAGKQKNIALLEALLVG
ncbi:MAG: phosphohydrolase [Chloroflexales bacterium]|nr:phosphohydrolase [Chloroflexales bacterium]